MKVALKSFFLLLFTWEDKETGSEVIKKYSC